MAGIKASRNITTGFWEVQSLAPSSATVHKGAQTTAGDEKHDYLMQEGISQLWCLSYSTYDWWGPVQQNLISSIGSRRKACESRRPVYPATEYKYELIIYLPPS